MSDNELYKLALKELNKLFLQNKNSIQSSYIKMTLDYIISIDSPDMLIDEKLSSDCDNVLYINVRRFILVLTVGKDFSSVFVYSPMQFINNESFKVLSKMIQQDFILLNESKIANQN